MGIAPKNAFSNRLKGLDLGQSRDCRSRSRNDSFCQVGEIDCDEEMTICTQSVRFIKRHPSAIWVVITCLWLFSEKAFGEVPDKTAAPLSTGPVMVSTALPPFGWLVREVGGAAVEVTVLLRPGEHPHTYDPQPRHLTAAAHARLFLSSGLPFENQLWQRLSPAERPNKPRLVDLRQNLVLLPMNGRDCDHAASEDEHAAHSDHHHEEGLDPHFWMDPLRMAICAETVARALGECQPAEAAAFRARAATVAAGLRTLHDRLEKKLAPHRGRVVYVYHPAFAYFCEAFGLRQQSVEQSGREPMPRHLRELAQEARRDGVAVIFTQPQFATAGAESVARAIDGKVVMWDDLAVNYPQNLESMAEALGAAWVLPTAVQNQSASQPAGEGSQ